MGASVDTIKYFLSGQDVRLRNYGILEPRVMFDMPSIMLEQPFVFTKIICDSLFWIKDSLNWSHSLSGYGSKSNNYLQKFGLFGNYYEINAVGSDKHSFQINYAKLGSCILGVKYWFAPDAVSEVNEAMEKIVIYPNPANQEIRLTTSSRKGTVVIRNLMGQIILQSELKSSIPLGQIPNGIYTIQFITKDGIQSDKLMIQ
jgi:hypothetical protein